MRLVTWNVQHGAPTVPGPPDLGPALPALAGLGGDVVALQELDRGRRRTGGVDQPALVAAALGAAPVFAPAVVEGGDYGVGLFVRGAVLDSTVHRLAGPGEPRVLVVADVDLAGGRWTVATTHLSTSRPVAGAQLAEAVGLLAAATGPVVLAGDLNLGRCRAGRGLARAGLRRARGPGTHSARQPVAWRRIDHVAVRDATVVASRVARLGVSDHLAVVVDLERVEGAPAGPLGRRS